MNLFDNYTEINDSYDLRMLVKSQSSLFNSAPEDKQCQFCKYLDYFLVKLYSPDYSQTGHEIYTIIRYSVCKHCDYLDPKSICHFHASTNESNHPAQKLSKIGLHILRISNTLPLTNHVRITKTPVYVINNCSVQEFAQYNCNYLFEYCPPATSPKPQYRSHIQPKLPPNTDHPLPQPTPKSPQPKRTSHPNGMPVYDPETMTQKEYDIIVDNWAVVHNLTMYWDHHPELFFPRGNEYIADDEIERKLQQSAHEELVLQGAYGKAAKYKLLNKLQRKHKN